MGEDARGYSWAPFQPGNTASVKHGAWSARSWRPLADAIAAELVEVAPWAAKDSYSSTVAAWSRTEAQIQLLQNYLAEHELLDEEGAPRGAAHLLVRLEAQAMSLRTELGLSPLALSRLIAVAERRGGDDHHSHDQLTAEIRRLVTEGRAVLGHVTAEIGRLIERAEAGATTDDD